MPAKTSKPNRESWLAERKLGIGGSDASAIVGMNPYKSNIELWEEKTGRVIPEDIGDKPYVKYGKEAEKHLTELFKLDYPQYEVYYNEFEVIKHPEHPFLLATLDGTLTDKETGRKGILEIKTTSILNSMHREKWNNQIPNNYYIQCLHYLLVTEYEYCILKAHLKTDWDGEVRINTKHYSLERSEVLEDIEYLKTKEIEFWTEFVEKDRKPGLLLPAI